MSIVSVTKAVGDIRDFSVTLNSYLKLETPLSKIESLLKKPSGSTYFTKFDMHHAYYY